MKRPDGIVVIAIYYALLALFFFIGSCALLFSLLTVSTSVYDPVGLLWSVFGIGVGLLFVLIFLIGSIMAAWGLLALRNWGRWAAIVLAVLQLPLFPVWTVIGGFIIYYLLREDVAAAFNGRRTPAQDLAPESSAGEGS